jgi:hypothetical protein
VGLCNFFSDFQTKPLFPILQAVLLLKYHPQDTVIPTRPITDLKSGVTVATKELATSVFDSITGIVVAPYTGYQKGKHKADGSGSTAEGVARGALGFGRYAVGIPLKICAGLAGTVAYPLQGGYKSLYSLAHRGTDNRIRDRKLEEGKWCLETGEGVVARGIDINVVLRRFEALKTGDGEVGLD